MPQGFRNELGSRTRVAGVVAGFILLGATLVISPRTAAQESKTAKTGSSGSHSQNWTSFFGNDLAWSYSPLAQITRDNVKQLVPVWTFPVALHGLESAPLVIDGVLYLETPTNDVYALDAATGKQLWKYTYRRADGEAARGGKGRGLASGFGLIFMGTNDNHIVAIDMKTGKEAWNVEVENRANCSCGINSAPLLVKDKIVTGVTGGEVAHRGYLTAFDAKTGKLVWRFYPIPAPGEAGSETWSGDSWKLGGGSTWFTGSYDPATESDLLGHRQSLFGFLRRRPHGRQSLYRFARRARCRHRQAEVVLPGNAARSLGLRFRP